MIGMNAFMLFGIAASLVLGTNGPFMEPVGILAVVIFLCFCVVGLYALLKRQLIAIYVVSLHIGAYVYTMVVSICEQVNIKVTGNILKSCAAMSGVLMCVLFAACGRSVAKSANIVRK